MRVVRGARMQDKLPMDDAQSQALFESLTSAYGSEMPVSLDFSRRSPVEIRTKSQTGYDKRILREISMICDYQDPPVTFSMEIDIQGNTVYTVLRFFVEVKFDG